MNAILLWIKESVLRLQATSPAYFKALQWASIIIVAICTTLLTTLPEATLNTVVFALMGWTWKSIITFTITGFGFVFGTSKLTAANPTQDVHNKL